MRGTKHTRARTLTQLLKPGAVLLLALSSFATTGGGSASATAAPVPAAAPAATSTPAPKPAPPPTPAPTASGPAAASSASPAAKTAPVQPAYPVPKPSPRPAPTAEQKAAQDKHNAENAARAKARSTGEAVPVDADTTEKTVVAANPDGSFTATTSLTPQRVFQDGAWATLDPTLAAQPDGRLRTRATTLATTFSGGGTAPLAVVDDRKGHVLTVTWPAALPKPVVSGTSALYADVLPGVDLKLTATTYSFSDVLVVHDAKAAANPALKSLRLGMSGPGLTVGTSAAGAVAVTDAAGKPVFQGPAPALWDSYRAGAAALAGSADPGPDADVTAPPPGHRGAMPAKAVSGGIEMTPDPAVLKNPAAVYPIVIDPEIGPAEPDDYYAELWSCLAWRQDSFVGGPGVGTISYPGGGGGTNVNVFRTGYYPNTSGATCPGPIRSMLEFDIRDVSANAGKVNSAVIDLNQQYGSCTATQIWTADPISTRTPTWYNTATVDGFWQGSRMSGVGSCSNTAINRVEFNVLSWINQVVSCGWQNCPTATVGLRTDNEAAGNFEAFYALGNGNLDPSMTVNYFVPPTIDSLWMDSTGVYLPKLPGASPSYGIHASVSDQDSGHQFQVDFTVGPNTAQGGATAVNSTGTQVDARIPAQGLTDGASYQIAATVHDLSTGMSTTMTGFRPTYTVAWSPPEQPVVTSGVSGAGVPYFPPSGSGRQASVTAGVAQTNAFHLRSAPTGPAGSPGVDHFDFVIDGDSSQAGPNSCTAPVQCGRLFASSTDDAWLSLDAGITHSGMNHLFLKAVDQAANVSWNTEYDFFVPGLFQPTIWGNVTGTGIPDIMTIAPVDPANPAGPQHLVTFPTNQDPSKSTSSGWGGSWVESAPATAAPDHTSWAGSLITHRGSQRVQPVDDMFAWKNGNLYYYDNVVGTGGVASEAFNNTQLTVITRPVCPACGPTYHGGDWSTVKQILALGPAKGGVPDTFGARTSLITVEDDGHQGANLWLFPTAGQGAVGPPTMIASCSSAIAGEAPCPAGWNWADTTLVAPGNAAGHPAGADGKATSGLPDLWVRDNNTGTLWMFPNRVTGGAEDPTGFGDFNTRVQLGAAGQFNAKSFPALFSNGNVEQNGNGRPDLFALTPNGQLTLIQSPSNTGGAAIPTTSMQTMSSAGWAGSYGFSSVDASPLTPAAGPFTLTPAAGAPRCLDDSSGGTNNGTAIQVWQCNASLSQAWTFASDGTVRWMGSKDADGQYDLCLDVKADDTTGHGMFPGTPVQLWTCNTSVNSGGNEKWQIRLDPSGRGSLYNPESGLCLDDPDSATGNGTRFQIWTCWDGNNAQLWDFPTAGGTSLAAEAENMLWDAGPSAPLVVQDNCCGASWSNGAQLWFQATAPNSTFTLDDFVPVAGTYAITPRMTTAPNYGQVRLAIDGAALPNTFDGYSPAVGVTPYQFGSAKLSAGPHKFTFTVTGADAASSGYQAGVDTVGLNWTTDTNPVISVRFPTSGEVGVGLTVDASASKAGAAAITGYGFDFGDGSAPVTGTAATAAHTYATPGTYTVKVTVTDSAGGVSTAVKVLTVSGSPTSWWKLNEGSGTTAADSGSPGGAPAAVAAGATLAPGGYATFDGTTGNLATTAGVLDTTKSFTVAAWVYLSNLTGYQTILTQQGSQTGGFHLEFENNPNTFAFARAASDTANASFTKVTSAQNAPRQNTWTHLIASYDVTTGLMTLYVNGQLAGTATDVAPIASTGPLVIGRGFFNGTANNFVRGGIADVRVYQQAFGGDLASWLYQNTGFTAPTTPVYGLSTPQTLTSSDGAVSACGTDPAHPATSTSTTPALSARLSGVAGLHADFEMRDVTDPGVAPPLYYGGTGSASGTGATVGVTAPALTDGHEYAWSARAHNAGSGVSASAPYCYLRVSVAGSAAAAPTGAAGAFFDNTVLPASAGPVSWSGPLTTLVWQTDGNLVLYKKNGQPIWSSGTAGNPGGTLALQSDGNLVVRSTWPLMDAGGALYGGSLWSSGTSGKGAYDLMVQTDGNGVIGSPTGPLFGMNGNVWNIANAAVGRCLDSNAQGQLYSNPCSTTNPYQHWIIADSGYGTRTFKDSATGLCLDGNGTGVFTSSCVAGDPYQQWYATWGGSGWVLKNSGTGDVLDMQTDGTPYFNTLNGGAYQQWD